MVLRVLFSEGSSLTAREFLSVLGPQGHRIEVADPNPACICRFSRWTKRVHPCPPSGSDPLGYLVAIKSILATDIFDVLLPTHEQAWLFAVAGQGCNLQVRPAVASAQAFSRVQSKIEFARLLDELHLPQPAWEIVDSPTLLAQHPTPYYLKTPYSTAGSGVRRVGNCEEATTAYDYLLRASNGQQIMLQSPVSGQYAQVQALFDHGRLVAAHTSTQTAVGIGPSAAGRESVDHPFARDEVARLGQCLDWHGGLTLDYIFHDKGHFYIECNPRTVEPANAAASGVDLAGLQLEISLGKHPPEAPAGRPGIRTHSAMAILLGTAVYQRRRSAVLRDLLHLLEHRYPGVDSHERLTPISQDFPSILPLIVGTGYALTSPQAAERLSQSTVKNYSVTADAIERLAKE